MQTRSMLDILLSRGDSGKYILKHNINVINKYLVLRIMNMTASVVLIRLYVLNWPRAS